MWVQQILTIQQSVNAHIEIVSFWCSQVTQCCEGFHLLFWQFQLPRSEPEQLRKTRMEGSVFEGSYSDTPALFLQWAMALTTVGNPHIPGNSCQKASESLEWVVCEQMTKKNNKNIKAKIILSSRHRHGKMQTPEKVTHLKSTQVCWRAYPQLVSHSLVSLHCH